MYSAVGDTSPCLRQSFLWRSISKHLIALAISKWPFPISLVAFFFDNPLFFFPPICFPNPSAYCVPLVAQSEKLRTTVRARFKDLGGKERLKNGALSNYVSPFFPGYHDCNGGARLEKKDEVNESEWGCSWAERGRKKRRERAPSKRADCRMAGGFITFR